MRRPDPQDPNPPAEADDVADADDIDALDLAPQAPQGRRHGLAGNLNPPMMSVMAHLCRKLVECGATGQMMNACNVVLRMPDVQMTGCPAAERCTGHIDAMICTGPTDPTHMTQRLLRLSDCIDATHC